MRSPLAAISRISACVVAAGNGAAMVPAVWISAAMSSAL
jgi:hypothetical protein